MQSKYLNETKTSLFYLNYFFLIVFTTFVFLLWNGIIPMSAPRMTARNAFGSQPQTFDGTVDFECFDHVYRTSRIISAGIWQNRTDDPLIQFYRYH